MLSSVDMQSLELIPGSFSNVKEWGQSDLAFKAKFKDGSEFFVGILLEHKSYCQSDVLSQIYKYTFEVMVNKNATDFRWLQTKAIIIYNGQSDWDPMAEFREKHREWVDGQNLPFECVLVNLADIPDSACIAEPNIEAAIGILVMKHAFDEDGLKGIVDKLNKLLSKMENRARATLVDKIVLYLQKTLRLGNGKASFPAALGLNVFSRVHRRRCRRGTAYANEYRTSLGNPDGGRPPPSRRTCRPSSWNETGHGKRHGKRCRTGTQEERGSECCP